MKKLHSITTVQGRNLPDLLVGATTSGSALPPVEVVERDDASRTGVRRKRKHSPEGGSGPVDPLSDLYAVLEGSALVPFLESKLQANSFLEIGRHSQVYRVIIGREGGRLGEYFKHCIFRYYQGDVWAELLGLPAGELARPEELPALPVAGDGEPGQDHGGQDREGQC